jgi:hypothetical protein
MSTKFPTESGECGEADFSVQASGVSSGTQNQSPGRKRDASILKFASQRKMP